MGTFDAACDERMTMNEIQAIVQLMNETDTSMMGLGGMNAIQDSSRLMTINQTPGSVYQDQEADDSNFSQDELKLAKKFVDLIGCVDRARDLVDKVSECEDCLDMDDSDDEVAIDIIGASMPDTPDMPTMGVTV